MGLSLLSPLFEIDKEMVSKIVNFNKYGYITIWILMLIYFVYAQYEAKKYRQCTSCQIGNQLGIIGKRLAISTIIFLISLFIF